MLDYSSGNSAIWKTQCLLPLLSSWLFSRCHSQVSPKEVKSIFLSASCSPNFFLSTPLNFTVQLAKPDWRSQTKLTYLNCSIQPISFVSVLLTRKFKHILCSLSWDNAACRSYSWFTIPGYLPIKSPSHHTFSLQCLLILAYKFLNNLSSSLEKLRSFISSLAAKIANIFLFILIITYWCALIQL